MDISADILALLFLVALAAGFVDAIAGGGGLLCIPALLAAGLSPAEALATNKLQACFGTASATWHFVRTGHVRPGDMIAPIAWTFVGAAAGTIAVQAIDAAVLEGVIPVLLVAVAFYVLANPRLGEKDREQRMAPAPFAALFGLAIGFYDGFFGPGTGSFWTLAFVTVQGANLVRATARTKVVNFTSNVTSLVFFLAGGKVVWVAGLVMAVGQFIGAQLGARTVTTRGGRIVRPLLVVVCLALTAKLVWG